MLIARTATCCQELSGETSPESGGLSWGTSASAPPACPPCHPGPAMLHHGLSRSGCSLCHTGQGDQRSPSSSEALLCLRGRVGRYTWSLHSAVSCSERRRTGSTPKPCRRGGGSAAAIPDALWLGTCMAEQLWHEWASAPCGPQPTPDFPAITQPKRPPCLCWQHITAPCVCHPLPRYTRSPYGTRVPCVSASVHRSALRARLQPGTHNCRDQEREDKPPELPFPGHRCSLPAAEARWDQPPLSGSGTVCSGSNSPAMPAAAEE